MSERSVEAKDMLSFKVEKLRGDFKKAYEESTDILFDGQKMRLFEFLKNELFHATYLFFEQFLYISEIAEILKDCNFPDAKLIFSLPDLRHKSVHLHLTLPDHCIHSCHCFYIMRAVASRDSEKNKRSNVGSTKN